MRRGALGRPCGRLPDRGDGLCSQPNLSRLGNGPTVKDVIRNTFAYDISACYAAGTEAKGCALTKNKKTGSAAL